MACIARLTVTVITMLSCAQNQTVSLTIIVHLIISHTCSLSGVAYIMLNCVWLRFHAVGKSYRCKYFYNDNLSIYNTTDLTVNVISFCHNIFDTIK